MNRIYLNEGWKFTSEFSEELLKADCKENEMTGVRIPHTVKETPFSYFDESEYQMVSGYRRILSIPEEWRGKKLLLTFEGVAHDSVVYCNGKTVAEHHCGYTAFTADITSAVHYGQENVLVVKVDSRESLNVPPFGFVIDYMTYGGIYRDVYLDVKEPRYMKDAFHYCRFDENSIFHGTESVSDFTLVSEYEISVDCQDKEAFLKLYLRDSNKEEVLLGEKTVQMVPEFSVSDTEEEKNARTVKVVLQTTPDEVMLWDTEHPVLYTLITRLYAGEALLDERQVPFGFRKAEFRQDGFYLNECKVKLRGLNRHQSYPYVGYAMPKSMQKLDADILKKELGVNAVRTSHYPQSHYFLQECDEIGLLVFTEIPGWQHIGDEDWKEQAIRNTEDMVKQYRNHPSIVLWGVRINESQDDDAFYERTNDAAHRLDPSRQTGGVRANKKSSLLEDVYTYNDFVHDGSNKGCEPKKKVTSDRKKGYLVSEYNGHMYPTKSFDSEEHRREHAIRHATVLNAIGGEEDIAGSFGWCMFDYNTHKDFGSGDRICYHGVTDMFRNPKEAAYVYACQQEKEIVLETGSSMDIGEHPGCNRGTVWMYTNAESVRVYKNDRFLKEYFCSESPFKYLKHGPIAMDDFLGKVLSEEEHFKPGQEKALKEILNWVALYGLNHFTPRIYLIVLKLVLVYHMKPSQVVDLYTKYIGDWGGTSTVYRFEAIRSGNVVKKIIKEPMREISLLCIPDHSVLVEENSYDVALVRIKAVDQNGNILTFFNEPIQLETDGDIELVGPDCISLKGGMGGTYVKSRGKNGKGFLRIKSNRTETYCIDFKVSLWDKEEQKNEIDG